MGLIAFDYRNPTKAGADAPARGTLNCQLLRREVADGAIRTTAEFSVPLADGVASVVLSDTGADQAWRVREGGGIPSPVTRYVKVAGDAAFVDLIDVDPSTLQPSESAVPAWDAVLGQVQTALDSITARTVTATVDPDDDELLILDFPTYQLDPDDSSVLVMPIGA